jgi:serine/threonine protein kinase
VSSLSSSSFNDVVCEGRSLASHFTQMPSRSSFCTCKYDQYIASNKTLCSELENITFVPMFPGVDTAGCSRSGCPPATRVYHTGFSFSCTQDPFFYDTFTLFETACQRMLYLQLTHLSDCFVRNCVACNSGLLSCNRCDDSYFLRRFINGTASCLGACPLGTFVDESRECIGANFSNDFHALTCQTVRQTAWIAWGRGVRAPRAAPGSPWCRATAFVRAYSLVGLHAACSNPLALDSPSCVRAIIGSSGIDTTLMWKILAPLLVLFIAAVVASLYFCVVMRRRNALREEGLRKEVWELQKRWKIAFSELTLKERLAEGAAGEVFRGEWRSKKVAVKFVHANLLALNDVACLASIEQEASLLVSLTHAHIVEFFGTGVGDRSHGHGPQQFLVTELLHCDLETYLQHTTLDWTTRRRFSYEIVDAMNLVVNLNRIHRDLKGKNILVTDPKHGSVTVKIADFGAGAIVERAQQSLSSSASLTPTSAGPHTPTGPWAQRPTLAPLTEVKGTWQWMAPEILRGDEYDGKVDVFSYGMVMWEIAAQTTPWADELDATHCSPASIQPFLLGEIERGIRPRVDGYARPWPPVYVAMMQRCWATMPSERPSFGELLKEFSQPIPPEQVHYFEYEEVPVATDRTDTLLQRLL